jgi:phage-related protein
MIAAIGAIAGVEWAALVPILPIVAAIAAVIAIGVALYRNWDQIKANTVQCWTSIKTAVSTAVNAIKSVISTVFGIIKTIVRAAIDAVLLTIRVKIAAIKLVFRGIVAIVGVVRSVFSRVKSFMTAPITAAVGVIRSAINRIKSFFRITLRFDGIKLPHIDISWKSSGSIAKIAKKMGLPGVPDFGVRWYANGGIFNQATVAGIGEAGTEAAVPLDPFWKRFDMMADRIVTEVGNQMQGTSGQNGNINMCLEVDGKQFASVTAPYMGPAITKIETRDKRKGGRR